MRGGRKRYAAKTEKREGCRECTGRKGPKPERKIHPKIEEEGSS